MNQAISGAAGTEEARAFVEEAYRSRSGGDAKSAEHPLAVAGLLREDGQPRSLVIAGLLHDLLEDTDTDAAALSARFGSEVARLVQALTQDPAIADYEQRKAALRGQILDAGPEAATVALADKAAKLAAESSRPNERRLEHYRATLAGIEQRYGRSPLSERLGRELERFPPAARAG